jgi:hypothetical protein
VENGTTCAGGQCWWGSCTLLADGGFGPDAPPPPPDGAQLDGPDAAEAPDGGADRHGMVGWSCSVAPGGVMGLVGAALVAIVPPWRRRRRRRRC